MPEALIDKDRCKGCELCKSVCPQKIISMASKINVKGYYYAEVADPSRCIGCCLCAITCPDQAIEVSVYGAQYMFFEY